MGASPVAETIARRWADKYVFTHHSGVFERARALNLGSALGEYDLLLWQDNDLLVPLEFIHNATVELRTQQLDYLIPYTAIRYLLEPDSQDVIKGVRSPAECKPVNVLISRRDVSGGMGLVRRAFVLRHGGMLEGFRGWGGEDNAWLHKARLLGRATVTQRTDQHLYHLFHPHSGGYGGNTPSSCNPYYADNVPFKAGTSSQ